MIDQFRVLFYNLFIKIRVVTARDGTGALALLFGDAHGSALPPHNADTG
jgi:hypothetical protein